MTLSKRSIMAALAASVTAFAAADALAVQPSAGIYVGQSQVTAVVASGGATCDAVGTISGTGAPTLFYYPGPNATGAVVQSGVFINNQAYLVNVTLPTTPAAGVTKWSGTGKVSIPGIGYNSTYTFSTTYNAFTADSFTSTGTSTMPGKNNQGTCKVTQTSYSIRTGQ